MTELREKYGPGTNLGNIPDPELTDLKNLGITHIWLMGVWSTGDKSHQMARGLFATQAEELGLNPDRDVIASPFSISAYEISPIFGSRQELQFFRQQLHGHHLQLILDAVFNHLGLDHPLVIEHPEYFIAVEPNHPAASRMPAGGGKFIAHGKDPYFAPWQDTYQLDITCGGTREWIREQMLSIARESDGVRCDMAMLLCKEVFNRTWGEATREPEAGSFWQALIADIKILHPQFTFIAEVYWNLERQLLTEGFDFVYDKTFYDSVVEDRLLPTEALERFVRDEYAKHALLFVENHDEQRIASRIRNQNQYTVAHLLLLAMPCPVLIHHGEMEGRTVRTPVQYNRWLPEERDASLEGIARKLLWELREHKTREGIGRILENQQGNKEQTFCIQWELSGSVQWIIVNYSNGGGSGAWIKPDFVTPGQEPCLLFCTEPNPFKNVVQKEGCVLVEANPWAGAILSWTKSFQTARNNTAQGI